MMQMPLNDVQTLMREHFTLSAAQVAPETELAALGIDSLGAIEFMFQLEERFGISLSEERGELRTVSDVVTIVEGALARKQAIV